MEPVMSVATLPRQRTADNGGPTDAIAVTKPKPGRLRVLDGLRLIAALLVVCWHYAGLGLGPDRRRPPTSPDLSARRLRVPRRRTVLPDQRLRDHDERDGSIGPGLCRVAGVPAVPGVLVRHHPDHGRSDDLAGRTPAAGPADAAVNLTMAQQAFGVPSVDAVYWTLYTELHFYVLFGLFVVWRGVTYRKAVAFSAGWLAVSVLAKLFHGALRDILTPDWAPLFVAGICFFLIHRFGNRILPWALIAVSYPLSVRGALGSTHNNARFLYQPMPTWPVWVLVALFYLLIAAVALGRLRPVGAG